MDGLIKSAAAAPGADNGKVFLGLRSGYAPASRGYHPFGATQRMVTVQEPQVKVAASSNARERKASIQLLPQVGSPAQVWPQ